MREIKFRAWDTAFNKMEMDCQNNRMFWHMIENTDRFKLQQFTGLKDRNGKDIYEGDIVKLIEAKRMYSVEFKEDTYKLIHAEKDCLGMDWGSIQRIAELGWHIEVIGNIFETP